MGRYSSILRSPKKEEQQVPDNSVPELPDINDIYPSVDEIDIMDEMEDIWGTEDEEKLGGDGVMFGVSERNFLDWDELPIDEGEDQKTTTASDVAKEFWEDEQEKIVNLKLNLNYQEVMDAWSGRGSLWADDCSHSTLNNNFMGEVPVMQEERSRREARVLRYREKRQNRLFSNSKKIRYQVRKINAESRPRLKGRFAKRIPDKMHR